MKDKKTIKREILDKFRSMNAENQETLPLHWLELVYIEKLSTDEKKLSKRAIQELISVGIVENVEGPGLNLRLTEKGQNLIYSSENQKSVSEPGRADGRRGGRGKRTGPGQSHIPIHRNGSLTCADAGYRPIPQNQKGGSRHTSQTAF
jgi:hypothetical protein